MKGLHNKCIYKYIINLIIILFQQLLTLFLLSQCVVGQRPPSDSCEGLTF